MLDQRSDVVFTKFVSEGFQRSNAGMRAVGVVTSGLITVEADRTESSVTGAFLG